MTMLILSFSYAVLVAADVGITLWAVRHGKGEEANIIFRPLVGKPAAFIGVELALLVIVVGAGYYYPGVLPFAIGWGARGVADNLIIIRSK